MRKSGFTVVELLIVIVVIAILAAITVVAYNGIQNRASESAVQSDITQLAKQIKMYEAEYGEYPAGGSPPGNRTFVISFRPTRQAYNLSTVNLYYCQGNKGGQPTFSLSAEASSGKKVLFRPETGITSPTGGSVPSRCYEGYDGDVYTITQGYHSNPSIGWADWTNG